MPRKCTLEQRTCLICGAVFRPLTQQRRKGGGVYCSIPCSLHRYPPLETRFWQRVNKTDTCWLWTGTVNRAGYGLITSTRDGRMTQWLAHRLSWQYAHGTLDKTILVLHQCDTPACVRPSHLFLGTHADNVADCVAKGRQAWQKKLRASDDGRVLTSQ